MANCAKPIPLRDGDRAALESMTCSKSTVLTDYDGAFVDIFAQIYQEEFAELFAEESLRYEHRLIDDMVAFALKSNGGYLWALKNYDGDVQADIVAQGFG